MQQITWRAEDDLVERVRSAASASGRSINEFVTRILDATTDPDLAGTEDQRVRERLARAGLLAIPRGSVTRPDPDAVAAAGRRAAVGTPVSEILLADRG